MRKSTKSHRPDLGSKPEKPYPDFPLTAHPNGTWCKKIRGRLHYFGPWGDWQAALDKYLNERDDLQAGRVPRTQEQAAEPTLRDLANAFCNHKKTLLDAGELSPRTFNDAYATCKLLVDHFGPDRLLTDIRQEDFAGLRVALAKRLGTVALGNNVQRIRSVFKHAYDCEMITAPVRFGPGFRRPSQKAVRLQRSKAGPKLFTAEEVRRLIDAAGLPVKAMILLGINCGFGNSDCGNLPLTALDLDGGWINFPRPKTGVDRRCPLWPETVAALREAIAKRPEPKGKGHAGLVFITRHGFSWSKDVADSPVTKETGKLLRRLGINGRKGLSFYTLRHTFRTIADKVKDQPAADHIMGHESTHMSSVYREQIDDERLKAVTEHVRGWLFPAPKKDKAEGKEVAATVE
jgi:integrase